MKFSLKWLQEWITLSVDVPTLVDRLTLSGTEVEKVETKGIENDLVVIAQIRSFVPHPNADRLRLCRVFDGKEERQIVCGAKNFKEGDKAPLALPGAKLPGGLTIKVGKLRGETSEGMMCSEKELSFAEESEGIMILPEAAPVGTPVHQYISGDTTIEVEITPNRGDLCSYRGMARELVAIGVATWKPKTVSSSFHFGSAAASYAVKGMDPGAPFYSGVRLVGLKVTQSPSWLQEKIRVTGHQPINNVVDITNYILWETGQPLHAFDASRIQGKEIEIRSARSDEKLKTLDGKIIELKDQELVIADASGPLALAGVIGGADTGVSESTQEIFLECASFESSVVRRSAKRHQITTDSSYRFERKVDRAQTLEARDRAIQLLVDLAGAQLVESPVIVGENTGIVSEIKLRLDRANRFLSSSFSSVEVSEILGRLGIEKKGEDGNILVYQAPSFRPDLIQEIDLFEELARIRGMEAVPSRLRFQPQMRGVVDGRNHRIIQLRQALAAKGWNECLTDPLLSRERAVGNAEVELKNPLNEQFTHLRSRLFPSLMQVVALNQSRGNQTNRIFEIGKVFSSSSEKTVLGVIVSGVSGGLHWIEKSREMDVFDLQGVIDYLNSLGVNASDILFSGVISSSEKKSFGVKGDCYYAAIDLDAWLSRPLSEPQFQELPVFPAVRRDIAMIVPEAVAYQQVTAAIQESRVALLEKIELFDRFQDSQGIKVALGHQSLAVALTYRASDRTLTDPEVNQMHDQIKKALVQKIGATIRGEEN